MGLTILLDRGPDNRDHECLRTEMSRGDGLVLEVMCSRGLGQWDMSLEVQGSQAGGNVHQTGKDKGCKAVSQSDSEGEGFSKSEILIKYLKILYTHTHTSYNASTPCNRTVSETRCCPLMGLVG